MKAIIFILKSASRWWENKFNLLCYLSPWNVSRSYWDKQIYLLMYILTSNQQSCSCCHKLVVRKHKFNTMFSCKKTLVAVALWSVPHPSNPLSHLHFPLNQSIVAWAPDATGQLRSLITEMLKRWNQVLGFRFILCWGSNSISLLKLHCSFYYSQKISISLLWILK